MHSAYSRLKIAFYPKFEMRFANISNSLEISYENRISNNIKYQLYSKEQEGKRKRQRAILAPAQQKHSNTKAKAKGNAPAKSMNIKIP